MLQFDLRGVKDVIYVGGGNTKSMLAVWGEWGLPELLNEAWRSGAVRKKCCWQRNCRGSLVDNSWGRLR